MMKRTLVAPIILMGILFFPFESAFSQNDATCEEIIDAAVQSTDVQCAEMGDNQACYGHVLVQALPQLETTPLRFAEPGDMADLIQLQSLRVSPLDVEAGYWGIALMQLLTQIPNASPEIVSLLVFGSVELEYLTGSSSAGTWIEVQGADVNVHESPNLSSPSLLEVWLGQFLSATGRLADDSWLRVEVPGSGLQGWVIADAVKSDEDLAALPIIDEQASQLGPLQVFQLETGLESGSPCDGAPQDGLLVQTPTGIAEVTFLVNEVNIQMRATAFLQAQSGREMTIAVLDGQAQVEAQGVTQIVQAGMMTRIPLDENLSPYWPPSAPESYQGNARGTEPLAELIVQEPAPVISNVNVGGLSQPAQVNVPPVQPAAPPVVEAPPPPPPPPADSNQNGGGGDSGGGDSDGGSSPAPGGGGGAPGGGGGAPG